jgi:hypothetical protein
MSARRKFRLFNLRRSGGHQLYFRTFRVQNHGRRSQFGQNFCVESETKRGKHAFKHLRRLTMKKLLVIWLLFGLFSIVGVAQTDADRAAIAATALDYAEGWYEGSADRMERALYPELAKRMFSKDEKGRSVFNHMGAMRLVQATRGGFGKNTPKEEQRKDVKILDVFENVASVRLDMRDWVDLMQIAKVDGRWVIVNVLWEMRPKK